jgi:hypothetical protein
VSTQPLDEELHLLEVKLKQLKLDYEQYFAGSRPREPAQARAEVQKIVVRFNSSPIKNTAMRFKFNTIQSRFHAWKRQWDNINRQIEAGTYQRHLFKANLRGIVAPPKRAPATASDTGSYPDLFQSYRSAAAECGQDVSGLTPEKLAAVVRKQESALREKLGCDRVDFRVVVQDGKVKLKASRG